MAVQQTIDTIIAQGMLPLYFNADEAVSTEVLRALYKAGVKAVEYTNRGAAAFSNFKKLVAVRDQEMQGLLLGIGTVKNLQDTKEYLEAGADFFVSPGFVPEIAAFAAEKEIFYAPGCMTPTEIIAAENAGVRFIKLFPGDMLGPKYLGTIKDIFPKLLFMPTGGVDATEESIEGWFKAGVCAVGMGSKLVSKQLMAAGDYTAIEQMTATVLNMIQSIKSK
ncbi:bifunctional 4-hydroxy-2-oxoglutarate aldolase/2-dehydro-3-deoxy-phosphogluconate aldolase [Niabella drilacis]|uniref:2-dehydro-3-deoxyphosphogluconate aldolase / (4S)-4-hydroxy-2-oxoglutarate aldolase n=1 Tax=Niabella drilacis (strain DSM 25811 / CCM 8410 / CCUG 62505 / LMG 26954 / E90) TaxID=1285928 RepID=A0A1G6SAN5_NIADE|nr:bifunctional 4-hydroxy-2-oxoglutarate aldolase/2-dehydro-3-deoxy-phosphogluconate aldolase [Niabella drilacis]SDD13741.1 2-dehydro-3-deoxyphosphogluconate aldolase / (4S)-4-hydroxy-2-oxoglutarate aldolase [Niabella drilacis]